MITTVTTPNIQLIVEMINMSLVMDVSYHIDHNTKGTLLQISSACWSGLSVHV